MTWRNSQRTGNVREKRKPLWFEAMVVFEPCVAAAWPAPSYDSSSDCVCQQLIHFFPQMRAERVPSTGLAAGKSTILILALKELPVRGKKRVLVRDLLKILPLPPPPPHCF